GRTSHRTDVVETPAIARGGSGVKLRARPNSTDSALALREHAWLGARSLRTIVEERCRPAEPADPPAKYPRRPEGKEPEGRRRGSRQRERPCGGALVETTERRAKCVVP